MNNFSFIGEVGIPKDTEKFKAFNIESIKDLWEKRTLTLNVFCGDNRHSVRVQDFGDKNIDNRFIYSLLNKNAEGKYTSVKIDFKDRESKIKDIAPFKKFVLDTGNADERALLYNIQHRYRIDEDSVTTEEKVKYNITSEKDIEKLIEKSYSERKEFICEYDFINALYDAFSGDKYKGCKFKVTGNYQFTKTVTDEGTKYYTEYIPTRVVRVKSETDYESTMNAEIIYRDSSDVVVSEDINEKKTAIFNGFLVNYNKNYKKDDPSSEKDISMPIEINLNLPDKGVERFKEKLDTIAATSEFKVIGLVLNCIDGSPTINFTEDMLTEDEKFDIECGLLSFDDIKKDKGSVKGERITEFRYSKIANGYLSGGKDTAYKAELFGGNKSDEDFNFDDLADLDPESMEIL